MSHLEITTRHDAQRLRCPRNHVVEPTNRHFWCPACARSWDDVDSEFDRVRDAKTGKEISRDELEFRGEARKRVSS